MSKFTLHIDKLDKRLWLYAVSQTIKDVSKGYYDEVVLDLEAIEDISGFEAFHFATLGCLIEYLSNIYPVKKVSLIPKDIPVNQLLLDTLPFGRYWIDRENYAEAKDEKLLNLWRVVDNEKEIHTQRVHDYLKSTFFQNKDLSAVKNSLNEVYYNIFDHAEAHGNAFSFIKYDESEQKLYVAVCDFGMGIGTKVRSYVPEIPTDH